MEPNVIATYRISRSQAVLGTVIATIIPLGLLFFSVSHFLKGGYVLAGVCLVLAIVTGFFVVTAIRNTASDLHYDLTEDGLFIESRTNQRKAHSVADLVQIKETALGEGNYRIEFAGKKVYWVPPQAKPFAEALAKAGGIEIQPLFADKKPTRPQ